MNSGYAVIFNQEKFKSCTNLDDRKGSQKDVDTLTETLTKFNITIVVHNNLSLKGIEEEVIRLRYFDFSSYKCFMIIILTHGKRNNRLFASDSSYILHDTIVNPIVNTNDTLCGKPKIFIVQACKGGYEANLHKIVPDATDCYIELPASLEMFFAYSSYENFVCYRDIEKGSHFIQAFCKFVNKIGNKSSITTVMEHVTKELSTMDIYKQLPSTQSTLTEPFIFGKMRHIENQENEKNIIRRLLRYHSMVAI